MKIRKLQLVFFKTLTFTLLTGVLLAFSSCATKKVAFATSTVVPAAEGNVKVKKDDNNNYSIELNVMRLADPKRLTPARETYVVWIDTENNGAKNIGQLKTSSGLFSSTLKSSLKTATAFKPVKVYITAEDNADIQNPSGQIVLNTNNF